MIPKFIQKVLYSQLALRQLQKERYPVLDPMHKLASLLIMPPPVSILPMLVY